MEFDKKTHKIKDWHLLSKEEARAYIEFLNKENLRHAENIQDAEEEAFGYSMQRNLFNNAMVEFYKSAIRRHEEHLPNTGYLIACVKHWFELGGEE